MRLFKDFKAFVMRRNIVDFAVAVVIAAAFGQMVSSFVQDILLPPLGLIFNDINLGEFHVNLTEGAVIRYGIFIGRVLDLFIVICSVFIIFKILSKMKNPHYKDCPKCLFAIPKNAAKCGYCTSDV